MTVPVVCGELLHGQPFNRWPLQVTGITVTSETNLVSGTEMQFKVTHIPLLCWLCCVMLCYVVLRYVILCKEL